MMDIDDKFNEWMSIDKDSTVHTRLRWEQDHFIAGDMERAFKAGYRAHIEEIDKEDPL